MEQFPDGHFSIGRMPGTEQQEKQVVATVRQLGWRTACLVELTSFYEIDTDVFQRAVDDEDLEMTIEAGYNTPEIPYERLEEAYLQGISMMQRLLYERDDGSRESYLARPIHAAARLKLAAVAEGDIELDVALDDTLRKFMDFAVEEKIAAGVVEKLASKVDPLAPIWVSHLIPFMAYYDFALTHRIMHQLMQADGMEIRWALLESVAKLDKAIEGTPNGVIAYAYLKTLATDLSEGRQFNPATFPTAFQPPS